MDTQVLGGQPPGEHHLGNSLVAFHVQFALQEGYLTQAKGLWL
jgi:hypothetical protein